MEGQFRNAHQGECLCPFIEQIIRDNPPLSAEAERRLLETMPREFAEQQIVLHCLGYAASIARSQSIPGMTLEDTFQLIVMVMVKAVKRFDVSKCDPSMSFTGFAKRAIERQLMRLGDPAWGSNDAKMNLLTSTLGEYGAGEDGDVEDSLSRMIQAGKDIACENAWSDNALPPLGIDNLVHEFRKYRETLGYTAKGQRERLESYLEVFMRRARGESATKIAADNGYYDRSTVNHNLNLVRGMIVRMLIGQNCPVEWKWMLEKSSTVRTAAKMGFCGTDLAWEFSRLVKTRDAGMRTKNRQSVFKRHYDAERCRYVAYLTNRKESQTRDQSDAKHAAHRAFREKREKSYDVMNYDRFLGCVYQRRYRLRNVYRPERGGTHTAEGYRACLRIEHEQQLGARMSNHEPPTERNKTWQHSEHR